MFDLDTPISLPEAVARLKAALGVTTLRVASSGRQDAGTPIQRVAVCAGAGGSLFEQVRDVTLFVTWEMRHHDRARCWGDGASVTLSEHTHTERGVSAGIGAKANRAQPGRARSRGLHTRRRSAAYAVICGADPLTTPARRFHLHSRRHEAPPHDSPRAHSLRLDCPGTVPHTASAFAALVVQGDNGVNRRKYYGKIQAGEILGRREFI